MFYNKEIAKRFVSDYKLPIPIIKEKYFFYHLNLYEKDYGSLTKYKHLLEDIDKNYNGNYKTFLDEYYLVRENIIQEVLNTDAFKKFNTMDMSKFTVKKRPEVTSNNIYNQDNIGHFFISIDLKKANFQTLRNIDKDIVFGCDTYEDFIGKFTNSEYFKESKYTREVVFGMMNPKRHITAEKYFITQIYYAILEKMPFLNNKIVSLSNDEIIFKDEWLLYNDKLKCFSMRKEIEEVCAKLGFEVHVEFFFLRGYNLVFKESHSVRKTFYRKEYIFTEGRFKLISAPLPYHSLIYKLYKGLETEEIDYHFDYEGMDARFYEEFDVEENFNKNGI